MSRHVRVWRGKAGMAGSGKARLTRLDAAWRGEAGKVWLGATRGEVRQAR